MSPANTRPSNVVQIAAHKKTKDIARCRAAEAAMTQFLSLMQQHGCRWVSLSGFAPDGTHFYVGSYGRDDDREPRFEFWVTPPQIAK